jgi:glycosyltransferase involved in cell wall biosynthesis
MPFSSPSGKAFTTQIIEKIRSKFNPGERGFRILDVGPGSGTYSTFYRQRLPGYWTGCEIWKPYIEKYELLKQYDEIICEDIRHAKLGIYDITFLGDVLEHMCKEDAISVVDNLLKISKFIIISIPIIHYPQGEYDGNPYEAHVKDDWSDKEIKETFGQHIKISLVENEIGVYILSLDNISLELTEPKIAVYGIFKNEEKFIVRFLESCLDADQIVLCDTGSTDKTVEIIKDAVNFYNANDRVRIEKITVLPWRFDDARNTALTFVNPDIDLCISLDSDEYLMSGWKQELINNYEKNVTRYYHRFCSYWNEDETNKSEHWHDRIHLRKGYKWNLPVHEILEIYSQPNEEIKWLPNFHMYQKPDMTKDRGSYLELLEVSVRERPKVWKSWSFLASEYYTHNRPDDALNALEKAILLPDSDKSFLFNFKATVLNYMDRFDEAIASLRTAINFSPTIREYNVYLAELYEKQFDKTTEPGLIQMAKMTIVNAEMLTHKTDGYVNNNACWDESFQQIKNRINSK